MSRASQCNGGNRGHGGAFLGGIAQAAYRTRSVPRRAAVMAAGASGAIIALDVARRIVVSDGPPVTRRARR